MTTPDDKLDRMFATLASIAPPLDGDVRAKVLAQSRADAVPDDARFVAPVAHEPARPWGKLAIGGALLAAAVATVVWWASGPSTAPAPTPEPIVVSPPPSPAPGHTVPRPAPAPAPAPVGISPPPPPPAPAPRHTVAHAVPPPAPPPPKPRNIPPSELEASRLTGDKNIAPDDDTKSEMLADGKAKVVGAHKVCIKADGTVDSVTMLKPTGYPAYDAKLAAGIAAWTYAPREDPVCTAVTFIYSQH